MNWKALLFRCYCFIVAISSLGGCARHVEQGSTYYAFDVLSRLPDDSVSQLLWKYWHEETNLTQKAAAFSKEWRFISGTSLEGLSPSIPENLHSGETVSLPHKVSSPDTPLWYYKEINFDQPGILRIRADDGAQLFLDGMNVSRISDGDFAIKSTGTLKVVVRVLNNAMSGELHAVSFLTNEQYQEHLAVLQRHARSKLMLEKILLLRHKDDSISQLAAEAIVQDDPFASHSLLQHLHSLPLLYPYLIAQDQDLLLKVLTDSDDSVRLYIHTAKGENQLASRPSASGIASFRIPDMSEETFSYYLTSKQSRTMMYKVNLTDHQPWSFNVWADSQGGWSKFLTHMVNIQKSSPSDRFGVGVGDLVANGSDSLQWTNFIKVLSLSAATCPYYLVPGNHDYDGYYDNLTPRWFQRVVTNRNYYSWYHQDAAFIALDPNASFPIGIAEGTVQYEWFRKEVASPKWLAARWRFIVLHQPPFSQGWQGYQGDAVIRELLEPICELAAIDFVISGHTHDYERLTRRYGNQLTTFLIVGGGGGSLEPPESSLLPVMDTVVKVHHTGRFTIDKERVTFQAIDSASKIIDHFTLIK